jgi:hypothetical protein
MGRRSVLNDSQLTYLQPFLTTWEAKKKEEGYEGGKYSKTLKTWHNGTIDDIMKNTLFLEAPEGLTLKRLRDVRFLWPFGKGAGLTELC